MEKIKKILKLALPLTTLVISFSYGQEIKKENQIDPLFYDKTDLSKLNLYGFGYNYEGNFSKNSSHDAGISTLIATHISSNTFLGVNFGISPRKNIYDKINEDKDVSFLLKHIETSIFIKPFIRRYLKVENCFIMPITDFNIYLAWRCEDNNSKEIRNTFTLENKTIFDWGLFIKTGIAYRITEGLLLELFVGKIGFENIAGIKKRKMIYHFKFNMKNLFVGLNFLLPPFKNRYLKNL